MSLDSSEKVPLGCSDIPALESYYYFDVDKFKQYTCNDIHVLILVTKRNQNNLQNLLLARYYKHQITQLNKKKKVKLFEKLLRCIKTNEECLEYKREGGSLGYIKYSRQLFQMMKSPNSTPRKSVGVIWLRQKNSMKWKIFYIQTRDGTVKEWHYSNPCLGGQFKIDTSLFPEFVFLLQFEKIKPLTAIIMEKLNLHNNVSPTAISNEILKRQRILDIIYDENNNLINKDSTCSAEMQFYQSYSTLFNNYTMVVHPVGRHNDRFNKNVTSKLENRFCMSISLDSKFKCCYMKHMKSFTNKYGRGGDGLDNFVFAIMDW